MWNRSVRRQRGRIVPSYRMGVVDGRIAHEVAEIKAMEERQENVHPSLFGICVRWLMVVACEYCGLYEIG